MGFCIYNNVGVAAKWVLQNFPRQVQRVLIIDWDVQYVPPTTVADKVTVTELRGYSMKILTFCIFLFIDMMMGHFIRLLGLRITLARVPE
jgi:acetoin utilization deacetylase AcuC-like enzyme